MREIAVAVRERPILFQGPMVRGLLREVNPKTQTRRAIKPQPVESYSIVADVRESRGWSWLPRVDSYHLPCGSDAMLSLCPYGVPRDRLVVREAFRTYSDYDGESMGDMQARLCCSDAEMARIAPIQYEANAHRRNWLNDAARPGRYRHARFMPRWASRILLEVTEVRVQRLQEISREDALAEGIVQLADGGFGLPAGEFYHAADPRQSYFALWESINGTGTVEANPWVWAVSFNRIKP